MPAAPRVFAGVLIGRAVTAQGRLTGLARPKMNPFVAGLDALLANEPLRRQNRGERFDMRASSVSHFVFYSRRTWWTNATAIDPSPTAEATRLMFPRRTSPTANTPGKLVSSK